MTDSEFIDFMGELVMAPDTVIRREHMKRALNIIEVMKASKLVFVPALSEDMKETYMDDNIRKDAEITALKEELRLALLRGDSLDRVVGECGQRELMLETEIAEQVRLAILLHDDLRGEIAALQARINELENLIPHYTVTEALDRKDAEIAALTKVLTCVLQEEPIAGEYTHLVFCSGDRKQRPGTSGVSCCCLPKTRAAIAALKKVIKAQERLLLSYRVGGRPPEWVLDVLTKAKDDGLI